MCNVCFKEFKGWCKSFTRTETLLSILEALLLVLAIVCLVFLILHFLACTSDGSADKIINKTEAPTKTTIRPIINGKTTSNHSIVSKTQFSLIPASECTWQPSEKTTARIRYFEYNTTVQQPSASKSTVSTEIIDSKSKSRLVYKYFHNDPSVMGFSGNSKPAVPYPETYEYEDETDFPLDESDGEEADGMYRQYVLALVKLRPPRDITFGCMLTMVTEYWTVTAASCIEAIEEVDSLDSFIMMEHYGRERKGRTHVISEVQIHPMYEGVNRSYDLVALKSEDTLMKGSGFTVELPSLIDYFMITIGERFTLLGYGPYRSIDTGLRGKRLHKVIVYTLPSKQCPQQHESWSLRHLWGGAPVGAARCGAASLCAGALHGRGRACNYCGGAPLLHGAMLVAVMAENSQCGVSCEPQVFVNVALLRDWLDSVTGTK